MRKTLIAVCAAVALAGCGGAPAYDERQHRADVEAEFGPVADWPKLRDNMRALCAVPAEQFAAAVQINAGASIDLSVHIKHLCPERLDETAQARGSR